MTKQALKIEMRGIDALIPYARNSRTHDDEQVAQIAGSIKEFGFTNPVLIDADGGIIAGHGRIMAARRLGLDKVPCITLAGLTDAQKRAYIIADNRLPLSAGWDFEMLAVEIDELRDEDFDISLLGFTQQELNDLVGTDRTPPPTEGEAAGRLADKFLIPPFSVLNAREGWWQDRKAAWIALGIRSEVGRGENSLGFSAGLNGSKGGKTYDQAKAAAKAKTFGTEGNIAGSQTGTSIFDPVLCELAYRWFAPSDGVVLDPFAGGSVRGIVAAKLGRQYIGHELRPEQVAANRDQAGGIIKGGDPMPAWIEGDSRNIDKTCKDVDADFVFSCPPYADLEVYSDNPADLSTLAYSDFREAYFDIILKACARLKNDRFACFVVGEVRDKKGNYYDFVGDTVKAFRNAGLEYYNEAILITAVGSLPIRAGKQFSASRKLGKTHQNVLVFVKGDAKKAVKACGDVEVGDECFAAYQAESGGVVAGD